MTELNPTTTDSPQTFEEVLQRLKAAAGLVEIAEIRFLDCRCSYGIVTEARTDSVEITVHDHAIAAEENQISSSMTLEFRAPSPFSDEDSEKNKRVNVAARIEVKYAVLPSRDHDEDAVNTFARVNAVQTAWPYFREYLHSSLVRLGLPAFVLPLLMPPKAAELAGLVKRPQVDVAAPRPASDSNASVGRQS